MNFSGLIQDFGPLTITGLAQGAIIALFALGYTLVYGVLRLINFAHSEVFLIGSYACLIVWGFFGLDQNSATPNVMSVIGLLLLGLVVAIIFSGLTALGVELVAYRPLRKRNAPPLAFLITAIGASLFISETVGVMTQRNIKGVPPLIQPRDVFVIGNMHVTNLQILIIVLALVMMFLLDRFINRSRLGRGIRAVAQNPDSAALMGVNKSRVISLVFLLGIEAFTAAVLGGIGNLRGALLGGLLLGLLQNYAASLFGTEWLHAASFVLLVLILLVRPTGLLGESLGRARA